MPKFPEIDWAIILQAAEEKRLREEKIENERQLELDLLMRIANTVERIADMLEEEVT